MIVLKKTDNGFERIGGNPTLDSIDGETRAPLSVILHKSWSASDRSKYGIFIASPFVVPEGKQTAGNERFEMKNEKVSQVFDIEAKDPPQDARKSQHDLIREDFERLAKRVLALESVKKTS